MSNNRKILLIQCLKDAKEMHMLMSFVIEQTTLQSKKAA